MKSIPPQAILIVCTLIVTGCVWNIDNTKSNISDTNLLYICGKSGMGVDFVTKNCTKSDGNQVNPYNLYPTFQSPLGKPNPSDSIMRCKGKAVDFVTGKCME